MVTDDFLPIASSRNWLRTAPIPYVNVSVSVDRRCCTFKIRSGQHRGGAVTRHFFKVTKAFSHSGDHDHLTCFLVRLVKGAIMVEN